MKVVGKLVVAAGIVVVVWGISLAVTSYANRKWRGLGRFTVVNISDQVVVESIDPAGRLGTRLIMPAETEISTLRGRGKWKPAALVVLAEKYDWAWVGESVADFLGITITGVGAELSIWDRLAWWGLNRGVSWREVKLDETRWVTEQTAVDGVRVLGLASGWESKSGELFFSSRLAETEGEVRVFNATDQPGLAARIASRIGSAGVRVIQVDESSERVEDCQLVVAPELTGSELVRWLDELFACEVRTNELQGRIVDMVLGTDFAKRYSVSD